MDLFPFVGFLCVIYSLVELVAAATRTPRSRRFGFGAVDADSGRPIEGVCDRRRTARADRPHSLAIVL